jgi:hypothetical protein
MNQDRFETVSKEIEKETYKVNGNMYRLAYATALETVIELISASDKWESKELLKYINELIESDSGVHDYSKRIR